MVQYVLKRVFYALITVFILLTITFILMHLLPGDPFTGERTLDPDTMAVLNAKYGLDKPLYEQYWVYVTNFFRGDMGISLVTKRPVVDVIRQAFPVSFELGVRSLIFALLCGGALGVVAAVKQGTAWDTGSMLIALAGVSIPSFIIGALLQYFLGLGLYQITNIRIFDIMGWSGESSKLLPSFALAFSSMAVISRLMRSSMIEVLNQDYIRTARAKGLSQWSIIWNHGIRNALMPVITVLGPLTAVLMTGTFVIENIFSIPGLGKYFVSSVQSNDYTMIAGTTVFFGSFLVLSNLIVDLLYFLLDPRIKQSSKEI